MRQGLPFALAMTLFMPAPERAFAGWLGAGILRPADPEAPHMTSPHIVTDNHGFPWAMWVRVRAGHESLEMSAWDGAAWTAPACVPNTDDHMGSYLDFVFDTNDDLFMVHPTSGPIKSFRYNPQRREWTGPFILDDTAPMCAYCSYPRIAIGGGEIWAAWFCMAENLYLCHIKAARWDRLRNEWKAAEIVESLQGGTWSRAWFADIAVDGAGTPHVVWTFDSFAYEGVLYYSRREGSAWREKERLTPDSLIPVGPHDGTRPRLVVDDRDNLHCCFLGSPPGDGLGRVYYCSYTAAAQRWGPIVRLDPFNDPVWPSWDKDIAVARPDNIWVAYDVGDGWFLEFWHTYVQHFDGVEWSEPERIDDGAQFRGGFPMISLDGRGMPFVVWAPDNTMTHFGHEIWYNRYEAPAGMPAAFLRGDADADGAVKFGDAIFTLSYLLARGTAPSCLDAADANDDGRLNIADAIAILRHVFAGTGPLPPPFPDCGWDETGDSLTCLESPACR